MENNDKQLWNDKGNYFYTLVALKPKYFKDRDKYHDYRFTGLVHRHGNENT